MPLNSTSVSGPPPESLMARVCRTPWVSYLEPLKMAPGVWYISGNDWVACYLIDTGDGLILIDTGVHESMYLMLENIRKIGYNPYDIKKILLSHAHADHIGAAKALHELLGAPLYLGADDLYFLHDRPDLVMGDGYTWGNFEPDFLYDYDKPIVQGNISIKVMHTPGHTPGCSSFMFDVKDKNGKTLTCAMHGGIGLNTLSDKELERANLPKSLREDFRNSLLEMDKLHVDICLPSHTNQVGILLLKDQITEDFNPYIDPTIWHELMHERIERVEKLMK